MVENFLAVFRENAARQFLSAHGAESTYGDLLARIDFFEELLRSKKLAGKVTGLKAGYGLDPIAFFWAVLKTKGTVFVLPTHAPDAPKDAQLEVLAAFVSATPAISLTGTVATHPLLTGLKARGKAGIIFQSSGTTGRPNVIVHEFDRFAAVFGHRRMSAGSCLTMPFDHIGGLNHLLYQLSNGGFSAVLPDRSPATFGQLVERHRLKFLSAPPTFLKLCLIQGVFDSFDFSSVTHLNYGSEAMPESTLKALVAKLPNCRFVQSYGMSECGVLTGQSEASDSTWLRFSAKTGEFRVRDGVLQIKSDQVMLGYLNSPTPFTEDGWFVTGDRVEQRGDLLRFVGRESEHLSLGGHKISLIEIEDFLLEQPFVRNALVQKQKHPLTGEIATAQLELNTAMDQAALRAALISALAGRDRLLVPSKLEIVDNIPLEYRIKKKRVKEEEHASE